MSINWLKQGELLSDCKHQNALLSLFGDTMGEVLGLTNFQLLMPSFDGRYLEVVSHRDDNQLVMAETSRWPVDDFELPFSHVLQTAKPMCLDYYSLAYWNNNPVFTKLLANIHSDSSVLLYPIKQGCQIKALFLCVLPLAAVQRLLQDCGWQQYGAMFAAQWQQLLEIEVHHQRQSSLRDTLEREQYQTMQNEQLNSMQQSLLGQSKVMEKCRGEILRAANTSLSVLIRGETGTGKELAARAIHDYSKQFESKFVAINCAAIPENLLESELFGHCKGAFSGADRDKPGLIEIAHQGTLFLDEIGDMPLNLQSKLLRVIEQGCFRPLGATEEHLSDFRLVSASHVDLLQRVKDGGFRRDLYYRLCQFPLLVPALSQRLDDLTLLSEHFLKNYNQRHSKKISGIQPQAIEQLMSWSYPGNVRELRNIVDYACAMTSDFVDIDLACLPINEQEFSDFSELSTVDHSEIRNLKIAVTQFEKEIISSRLAQFNGDRGKTALSLGLPKRTLSHKCMKLEIQ